MQCTIDIFKVLAVTVSDVARLTCIKSDEMLSFIHILTYL